MQDQAPAVCIPLTGGAADSRPALVIGSPEHPSGADFAAFSAWSGRDAAGRMTFADGSGAAARAVSDGRSQGARFIFLSIDGTLLRAADSWDAMEAVLARHGPDLPGMSFVEFPRGSPAAPAACRSAADAVETSAGTALVFRGNVSSLYRGEFRVHPNLIPPSDGWIRRVCGPGDVCTDLLALKTCLLNNGVSGLPAGMPGIRPGVNGSVDITLECGPFEHGGATYTEIPVNCSYGNSVSRLSAFTVESAGDGDPASVNICYLGRVIRGGDGRPLRARLFPPAVTAAPSEKTPSGVPLGRIAFLATDRVRFQHNRTCEYAEAGAGCRFCEFTAPAPMGYPAADFGMEDVLYAVGKVLSQARPYSEYLSCRASEDTVHGIFLDHVLIGGGSVLDEDVFMDRVLAICRAIRGSSERVLPVYLMCLPFGDADDYGRLREAGVTEVAFNIEVYDPDAAAEAMPGKSGLSRDYYFERLEDAVRVWPEKGAVRSALIIGLEPAESTLECVRRMAAAGISPMLSIFRPTAGTPMAGVMPPDSESLYRLFLESYYICKGKDVEPGPACIHCQNNTLSLPSELVERSAGRPVS